TPDLATGLRLAAAALAGPERALSASDLEVAVLDRQVEHRSFRRLAEGEVDEILGGHVGGATAQTEVESVPEAADLPLAATVTTDTGATDLATAEPRQATGVSSPSESNESKAESDDDEAAGT
ncbi:MAG: proteasome subunit alpha, partial [Candidatus Microthrix parvicella]